MASKRIDIELREGLDLTGTVREFDLVAYDGKVATESTDAKDVYGVALSGGIAGDRIAVCRRGFCPVRQADSQSVERGDKLIPAASGEVVVLPDEVVSGGIGIIVAIAQEDSSGDGVPVGAYVDCVSQRTEEIPASD